MQKKTQKIRLYETIHAKIAQRNQQQTNNAQVNIPNFSLLNFSRIIPPLFLHQ